MQRVSCTGRESVKQVLRRSRTDQHNAVSYIWDEQGTSVGRTSASIMPKPLHYHSQHAHLYLHLRPLCGVDPTLRGWSSWKNLVIWPPPGYQPVEIAGYRCYIQGPMRTQGPFYLDGSRLNDGRAGAGIVVYDTRILARVSGEQESYRAKMFGLHLISHATESHHTAKLTTKQSRKWQERPQ